MQKNGPGVFDYSVLVIKSRIGNRTLKFDSELHHRRSIRLRDYDYSMGGGYFVTICAKDGICLFGEIVDNIICFNEFGRIVAETWESVPDQNPYVELDSWTLTPNHLHGILVIHDGGRRGGSRTALPEKRKPLGRIIGAFKTVSAKRINVMRNLPGAPVWQRNYFEHIIRSEESLNRIRKYIQDNPAQWIADHKKFGGDAWRTKDRWSI